MVVNTKKRGRGRPRAFDLPDALDKAVAVFWELGYEAADTETLTASMGISKPSLYNTFGSKEQLFLSAIERYGDTHSKASQELLVNAPTPKEGLRAFFDSIARDVSGKYGPSGCLIACVAIAASERIPKVATSLERAFADGEKQISHYFQREIEKGVLPDTFNVTAAVLLLYDLMFAMGLQGRMGDSLPKLKKAAKRNADLVIAEGVRKKA